MSIAVVDVGTSSVRASIVADDGVVRHQEQRPFPVSRPTPGVAELDAAALARSALEVASAAIAAAGKVDALAIATQRASTVVWERATGRPVAPGIGWEDLRTVGRCLALRPSGIRLAPNQSATKLALLLEQVDATDRRALCFGTLDTWMAWTFTGGKLHVTDATNAAVTGLVLEDASGWDERVLDALAIPPEVLPEIVDSAGLLAPASALPGAPVIAALVADQQASLVGQGCLEPGSAKGTFGTGAMLDATVGTIRPPFPTRGPGGTFPIVAWRLAGRTTWGLEAIMLAAGSCLAWLRDGLGLLGDVAESDSLAASVRDAGGVIFVPALAGMGSPVWDFGARGAFIGLSASTSRAELVHAVLEGIAQRGADLLEALEADGGRRVEQLRVDGGMSANASFLQLLANALQRPVLASGALDATTLGAAFLAGTAVGTWGALEETAQLNPPRAVIEPRRRLDRERWLDARARALRTVPSLSALDF
ncbi:MAG TPA: FGGY-family carbohydrate kinase [Acidimicrobiales bacterium]|nr:FGGY-family carbohydrate kinase [Acidimicrobiales bacterium]